MAEITIDKACCKGCEICFSVCTKRIFVRSKKRNDYGTSLPEARNAETCLVCRMCERLCPDGAISVERKEGEANAD